MQPTQIHKQQDINLVSDELVEDIQRSIKKLSSEVQVQIRANETQR